MSDRSTRLAALLASTSLLGCLMAPAANAQESAADAGANLLSDVVVTATRQADTVSRVPLSVTAVTQRALDVQGIRTVVDLQRVTPGVGIQTGFAGGGANSVSGDTNISIRGIAGNGSASPTTGIYLDDVSLQKRGNMASGSNSPPIPRLFDLERVEVLRGPQGTLYGGSAEGGAIRFITPAPSLTRYSGQARAELSTLEDGGESYEAGIAAGGPIIPDKLGFRASIFTRHNAGYIDHVSLYTGRTTVENSNYEKSNVLRLAVTWSPTERLSITPAFLFQSVKRGDNDFFMENLTTPYTVPAFSSNAAGRACTPTAAAPCPFNIPAITYGPYLNYGPFKHPGQLTSFPSGAETPLTSPSKQRVFLPVVTVTYDFDGISARLISSYIKDTNRGYNDSTYTQNFSPQVQGYPVQFPIFRDAPDNYGVRYYQDNREGIQEELRFSSSPNATPLSWVGGIFYTHSKVAIPISSVINPRLITALHGVSATQYYGLPLLPDGTDTYIQVNSKDTEVAAYGEANYFVTEKLKLTGGIRFSRNTLDYRSINYGQARGYLIPTLANGGLTQGQQVGSAVTPKFGASYQIDERNMVYTTIAKGYRPGGVNITPVLTRCAAEFAASGLPATGPDQVFDADSTWSYEAGAKVRLFGGRAQINSSLYHIDWKNIQSTLQIGGACGFNYQDNAGTATSRGFDVQAQGRLGPFTLSANVGYTNAKYKDALFSPTNQVTGTRVLLINKDDRIPFVPDWQYSLGLQYDVKLGDIDVYLRGDYQYIGNQRRGFGPGTATYAADVYKFKPSDIASLRAGVIRGPVEVSAFINNLFDSQDRLYRAGGTTTNGRNFNPLFFSSTFRPREFGLTAHYRY